MLGETPPQQPLMRPSEPGGPNPAPGTPRCCLVLPSQGTPYPRLSLPWRPGDTLQDPLCDLLWPKAAPAFAGPQGRGIGALPPTTLLQSAPPRPVIGLFNTSRSLPLLGPPPLARCFSPRRSITLGRFCPQLPDSSQPGKPAPPGIRSEPHE